MIVDLFSGPRGWSEGLKMLGLTDVGLELDATACLTARAAGHLTIRADVERYPTEPFVGKVHGLIASPPCPDFSMAGKRAGIIGESGRLMWEVVRWVEALQPEWIACEQVPPALMYWKMYAHHFEQLGYSTWTGVLCAADYGVPQTRNRAFLLASRSRRVFAPPPTHCKGGHEGMFGSLEPWVSMASALGWGDGQPWPTIPAHHNGGGPDGIGGSGARESLRKRARQPGWVVDRRTRSKGAKGSMVPTVAVPMERPSPTFTGKAGGQWVFSRPATTVCADPRIGRPGHKDREGGESQFEQDSIKLTVDEALILQSFRPDYPVVGSKTKAFEQIGNAVPPVLAAHALSVVTGRTMEVAA